MASFYSNKSNFVNNKILNNTHNDNLEDFIIQEYIPHNFFLEKMFLKDKDLSSENINDFDQHFKGLLIAGGYAVKTAENTIAIIKKAIKNKSNPAFSDEIIIALMFACGYDLNEANLYIKKFFNREELCLYKYDELIYSYFLKDNSIETACLQYKDARAMINKYSTFEENDVLVCAEIDIPDIKNSDHLQEIICSKHYRAFSNNYAKRQQKIYHQRLSNILFKWIYHYVFINKIGIKEDFEEANKIIYSGNDEKIICCELIKLVNNILNPYSRYISGLTRDDFKHDSKMAWRNTQIDLSKESNKNVFSIWLDNNQNISDYVQDELEQVRDLDSVLNSLKSNKNTLHKRIVKSLFNCMVLFGFEATDYHAIMSPYYYFPYDFSDQDRIFEYTLENGVFEAEIKTLKDLILLCLPAISGITDDYVDGPSAYDQQLIQTLKEMLSTRFSETSKYSVNMESETKMIKRELLVFVYYISVVIDSRTRTGGNTEFWINFDPEKINDRAKEEFDKINELLSESGVGLLNPHNALDRVLIASLTDQYPFDCLTSYLDAAIELIQREVQTDERT